MNIETIRSGNQIPYKLWLRATDALARYRIAGLQWIAAGKAKTGQIYSDFCDAETEYNKIADAIWFAKWTPDQRAEWERINENTETL